MTHTKKQDALQGVWDATRLFPFSLAAGVCSGFGLLGGAVSAAVCLLFGAVCGCAFFPTWLSLLPVFLLAYRFGAGCAGAAVLLGGALTCLLSLMPRAARERLTHPAAHTGFAIAAAFVTTALQTTNYFGIGAAGGTAREIIADYISLGFHANWRGVLYGTIALVLLITYPRKFKTLRHKIAPAFTVLLIVFPLHLLLVPRAEGSPINEIGKIDFSAAADGMFLRGAFTKEAIPLILCSALALALLTNRALSDARLRQLSGVRMCAGFFGGLPCDTDGEQRGILSALTAALVTAALYCLPGLARFPVHALAVILIVTAWQCVPWGGVRTAFASVRGALLFCASLLLPVLAGVHYAVPLLCALCALTGQNDTTNSNIQKGSVS